MVQLFGAANAPAGLGMMPFDPAFPGGVRVATGDVTGDGVLDLVTAAGPGSLPLVQVFDGQNQSMVRSFFAYDPAFTGGVFIAAGDVNGDSFDDIITAPDAGGGPHVIAFSGRDGGVLLSFMAYDPLFGGGVAVGAGDVTGDGMADIITGPGPGGLPLVEVFSGRDGSMVSTFFAYDPAFGGGIHVAGGDVNGDGVAEVVTGTRAGGGPLVQVFSGAGGVLASFLAYDPMFGGGVRVATTDADGDGRREILLGAGPGGAPLVRILDGLSLAQLDSYFALDPAFTGGVFVG